MSWTLIYCFIIIAILVLIIIGLVAFIAKVGLCVMHAAKAILERFAH